MAKNGQLPTHDIEKGKFLGKGQGADGVFKGKYHMPVALKKMNIDKQYEDVVCREVQILSKLLHPNIILYLGTVTLSDGYYIVTELAEKGSLWDYLQENPIPKLLQSLRWAKEIAAGVQYLHQQDHPILHRDLKSPNVLLKDDLTAKIADFGSAKIAENISGHAQLTSADTGTYQWMAPEAIDAMGNKATTSMDVFSYGIVLWELLTHKVPYEPLPEPKNEKTRWEVLKQMIKDGERPKPIPEMCDKLISLMQRCWGKEPEKRPNIVEVLKELKEIRLIEITEQPEDYEGRAGEQRTLKCCAEEHLVGKELEYEWVSVNQEDIEEVVGSSQELKATSTLTPHKVFCRISTKNREVCAKSRTAQLTWERIWITAQPKPVKYTDGDKVILTCKAEAPEGQKITYQWFKLGASEPVRTCDDGILSFQSISHEDKGQYFCKACIGSYGDEVTSDTVELSPENELLVQEFGSKMETVGRMGTFFSVFKGTWRSTPVVMKQPRYSKYNNEITREAKQAAPP